MAEATKKTTTTNLIQIPGAVSVCFCIIFLALKC